MCFVRLAKNWPKLMEEWTKVDASMVNNYGYPKYLDRKLKMGSFIVMFLAIVEYHLSIAFHVTDTIQKYGTLNSSLYYTNIFPQVFSHISYSVMLAILIQVSSKEFFNVLLIMWKVNFLDRERYFDIFMDLQRFIYNVLKYNISNEI